ncbi:hypothetical protein [Amycolatopsis sp. H20-H5]|uniref:hypothetical protein n=1 Tax=Amycolatopsis sp. H20-H5 TaxID=3046309 RepID=UPI002DB61CA8|nr:hypothetical protein [Amycolatopsis sp. H20-H5]MEC3982104.1 hypothetical protein [Amycolatopsis sp. H20-H5]
MEFVDSIASGSMTSGRVATAGTHQLRPGGAAGPATVARSVSPLSPSAAVDPRTASIRRYEGGQLVWRVQVGDLISRERAVTVFVEDNQVVLVSPPGETARMTTGQLGQLRAALNEAAKLAER